MPAIDPSPPTCLPDWAAPWIETVVRGPFRTLRTHRDGSGRTGVWELQADAFGTEPRVFFKTHNRRSRWGAEVHAYRILAGPFAPYLPSLLGVLDDGVHVGLLLLGVDGTPLRERSDVPVPVAAGAYRAAGECLRRLYDPPPARDSWPWFGSPVGEEGYPLTAEAGIALGRPTDAVTHVSQWLESAMRHAADAGALSAEDEHIIEAVAPLVAAFIDELPVPTHTDFTPGNWLVGPNGRLAAIIDLENVYFGTRIDPFIRLLSDYFPLNSNPRLRSAFAEGFGEDLPERLPAQAAVGLLGHGLHYIADSAARGGPDSRERGLWALYLAGRFAGVDVKAQSTTERR